MLKAAYYARLLNQWTMADDSGLEVDALEGKPGVHSARWAEMHSAGRGDMANNELLLAQLRTIRDYQHLSDWPTFSARFACVLALSDPSGRILLTTAGQVEGRIVDTPRGANGFGYGPLFLIHALGKTTAELDPSQKHAISHRGAALRRMNALILHHVGPVQTGVKD
jgi:XTP/dITP diphosphohydrolase